MWLKRLEIKNYKSIEDLTINFTQGINVIFGENGTGKTNIIKAILKLLGPTYPGLKSFQKEDYFGLDESRDIIIKLIFDDDGNEISLEWNKDERGKWRLILNQEDYIDDKNRERFCPLHIPPNREIKDLPGASRWTPIGRIIYELSKMIETNQTVYSKFINKMGECINILENSPEFSQFKKGLERYSSEQIGRRGENINVRLGLIDHKNILKTLQIFEMLGNEQYNLSEGGQGIQSNVTMAALRAFSDVSGGRLFIIADEPEAYLHPLAQQTLCKVFEQIANSGTQIILTTHSPYFISSEHVSGLIRVWMENSRTQARNVDINKLMSMKRKRGIVDCTSEGTLARLGKILSLRIKEGLFAKTVVLCEGESEAFSLETWSEIGGYDLAKDGIAVVPSNGKFSMIDLAEWYQCLKIPVYLIFDSDGNKTQNRDSHAKHNRWLLEFANEDEIVDFPETKVGERYCVMSPNFESVLRKCDSDYETIESEINNELGLEPRRQKGIRAKHVAQRYKEEGKPMPSIINKLLTAIYKYHKQYS